MTASRLSGGSWSQTIRLLFRTPLVPAESKQEKVIEIGMVDLSPTNSNVSSQRNSFDFSTAPADGRVSSSASPWSSNISL
ncbi:hypothetical protein PsYK624_080450 [Phanerochaete sordida]|uniref:Uncharacterized protein n=1 Tax=Phanerochaete sordida TaxID=48140 RepID=A0A9P3GDP6_9APHY|nr:hypothetical protein PsYK624_080450 [Phanerochaete sordida]